MNKLCFPLCFRACLKAAYVIVSLLFLCNTISDVHSQEPLHDNIDTFGDNNAENLFPAPKIAVIGAGIGGASTAHFIREKLGTSCQISVFEPNHVGGRLATVMMANQEYEIGGSIIHSANKIMTDLVETVGLHKKDTSKIETPRFSLVTKEGVVFQESTWSALTALSMVWRYGLFSLLKLNNYITNMLDNFANIYPYLDKSNGDQNFVTNVLDMLKEMSPSSIRNEDIASNKMKKGTSMLDELNISLNDRLKDIGINDRLIDELVSAAVRVNYGQMPTNVHAFVGSVALAGMHGDLWSIDGGNYRVAEELVRRTESTFLQARVSAIELHKTGKYVIAFQKPACENRTQKKTKATSCIQEESFDIVIIAAPQTTDKDPIEIKLPDSKDTLSNFTFPGRYHRTVATLVHGDLNPEYVGCVNEECMTDAYFFVDPSSNINSIGKLLPVRISQGKHKLSDFPNVWKVFSQERLSREELKAAFPNIVQIKEENIKIADWLAYPSYAVRQEEAKSAEFRIHKHLYYTNCIEWSASAMEMSAIAAKNVVNMALHDWREAFNISRRNGRLERSSSEDQSKFQKENKEEL